MKRLRCWLDGHDYFVGLGNLVELGFPVARLTICMRCGVKHLERLEQPQGSTAFFEDRS